jgi:nucleotide-binding universal stress UspA family protein
MLHYTLQSTESAMFAITSILVPTDFSENAHRALNHATELARVSGASVHLIHIVEPVVYPADWSYAQVGFADIEQELVDNATKELGKLNDELSAMGIEVHTTVRRGRASDEICTYSTEHSISMIVIGTHGRSGLEHFLFGSTTERVLRKAPCPVLSVRLPAEK